MTTCYTAALRLLAFRGQLEEELQEKLLRKGFSRAEINAAIDKLRHEGYLDQMAEIQRFIERRFAAGDGPRLIAMKLSHLLNQDAWNYVKTAIDSEREKEKIKTLLSKGKDRKKTLQKLYRKGFEITPSLHEI